tara:strand:+ start:30512 stop:30670 length:159 start_codon:yes stop_codon:yes gene_type:complete
MIAGKIYTDRKTGEKLEYLSFNGQEYNFKRIGYTGKYPIKVYSMYPFPEFVL